MKSLQNLTVKVLNIDIVKYNDGTEFLKLQGIVPMSEYRKKSVLAGEYEIFDLFDKYCDEYDNICAIAKDVETVTFSGFYEKFKFKPVSLVSVEKKKG